MDLDHLSDSDLKQIASGNLNGVSDEGLHAVAGWHAARQDGTSMSPSATGFVDGMTTNMHPADLAARIGRGLPRTAGMVAGGFGGTVAGTPVGGVAGAAIGGAAGESARQGMVAARGGNPNLWEVPGAAAEGAAAELLSKPVRAVGEIALGGLRKLAGSVGEVPPYALDQLEKAPMKVAGAAGKAKDLLPPVAARIRSLVNAFEDKIGSDYAAVKDALVQKFGNKQILSPAAVKADLKEVLQNSSFNPKSKMDQPAIREARRLIADASKPFSGTLKGATDMSERFNRALEFGPNKPIHRGGDSWQQLIGDLKGAYQSRLDKRAPEFADVRAKYAEGRQLVNDARTFLNSKNLAGSVKTAESTGNLDLELIDRLQTKIPRSVKAFEDLRQKLGASMIGRPGQRYIGGAYGAAAYGTRAVMPVASRAAGAAVPEAANQATHDFFRDRMRARE